MKPSVGFDSQIVASRYEIHFDPDTKRVKYIVQFGGDDWRELNETSLRTFLTQLGITADDCREAFCQTETGKPSSE